MDKMAFDLRKIPCVQNGVAETLSRLGDGAIEIAVREVDGQFVNAGDEEEQCGRDSDPDPARQGEALAEIAHLAGLQDEPGTHGDMSARFIGNHRFWRGGFAMRARSFLSAAGFDPRALTHRHM
jgi:hypothetical protein